MAAGLPVWPKYTGKSCKQGFAYFQTKKIDILGVKSYLSLHCSHLNILIYYVLPRVERVLEERQAGKGQRYVPVLSVVLDSVRGTVVLKQFDRAIIR